MGWRCSLPCGALRVNGWIQPLQGGYGETNIERHVLPLVNSSRDGLRQKHVAEFNARRRVGPARRLLFFPAPGWRERFWTPRAQSDSS